MHASSARAAGTEPPGKHDPTTRTATAALTSNAHLDTVSPSAGTS